MHQPPVSAGRRAAAPLAVALLGLALLAVPARATAPDATAPVVSEVTQTTAVFQATVDQGGVGVDSCTFEYGTTTAYESSIVCLGLPRTGPLEVSAFALTLTPATRYHVKTVATNGDGNGESDDVVFDTLPDPPLVTTSAATRTLLVVGPASTTSATLGGTVNPNGGATTCRVEYGTTSSYGSSTACDAAPGAGTAAPVAVRATVAGLHVGTYHYRLVAKNAGGTTAGDDATLSVNCAPDTCCDPSCGHPHCEAVPRCGVGALQLVGRTALVRRGRTVRLRLACVGQADCDARVTLTAARAQVPRGHGRRRHWRWKHVSLRLGAAHAAVPLGHSARATIHLSRRGRRLLARARAVRAVLTTPDVAGRHGVGGYRLLLKERRVHGRRG